MKLLTAIFTLSAFAMATQNASASEPIFNQADAAQQLAEKVASVIGNNREVFVREFRGFGEHHVGLSKLVGDALTREHSVSVRRGSPVEVEGRIFRFPTDLKRPLEGYTIKATVVLPEGERKFSFDVENRDEGHIAVGKSGEKVAPPKKSHGSLPDKTGPFLDGNIIRPSKGSPYGVEFLKEAHGAYQPIHPLVKGSHVFVRVHKGDLIACRLHNGSGFEAASDVLIDGLSRFALSDDPHRKQSLDLVANGKPRIIKGYFRDTKHVDAFRVGEYSRSVAAKLLPEGQESGTFTIAFRAAWDLGQQPPPNEAAFSSRKLGIERGPQRDDKTRHVQRNAGVVRAVVKIFYGE